MSTQSRKTLLLATSHSGSVLGVVDATNNHAIDYTPYGDSPTGDDSQSQLRFNGVFREAMTGWYSLGNGYRMYSPVLMRFLSPDSLSPFGKGGLNTYAYCGGDPINRQDPNGRAWFNSLTEGLKQNLAITKTEFHPTQKLSNTTIKSLQKSLTSLGGEDKISKLAKKSNVKPYEYLINNMPEFQEFTTPIPPANKSSIPILEKTMKKLTKR
ncbi:hypothetical protein DKY63_17560 [Pseudomonas putida]|uniref:RHS repeat-associated core domain-containing protein n=1 Tax=Pseudomonas putida TaxID=303 RepID=A0A2Z4RKX8_PSEPU|nr:RHS repeat-associated core domain-containing protein [Pseudomonas putida]AWY41596.1 hypothetical protein DKY63_17560 [Pseudomonas putida]